MKNIKYYLFTLIMFSNSAYTQNFHIPDSSRQLIIVLTDSAAAVKGQLYQFIKTSEGKWVSGKTLEIVLGRNGLAWGRGLNSIDTLKLPIKIEGDGKSPAGVFTVGPAFGYEASEKMKELKIPYIHVNEMLECIDDINSEHYNQLVLRNEVKEVDWNSSEKMAGADPWYELGIVVNHNTNPVNEGSGSCIFLHNWACPDETSAGCTELDPTDLKELVFWLDASSNPLLVQLTRELYMNFKESWKLPDLK